MIKKNNNEDIFIELAKVKSEPPPLNLSEESGLSEESEGQLTVDVYQKEDEIVIQSTVAGVEPDDLEINITSESVTIRGKREKIETVEDKNYFYQECFWGRFSRSIILPQEIDSEKATAVLKKGILTIHLPKLDRVKAKKVRIKVI